jgi:hypothetical protein
LLFTEKRLNLSSGPSMNSSPSGGEDLHMVQRDKSLPRLRETAGPEESGNEVPVAAPESTPPPASSGRFTFVASLLLIALAFSLGLSYFFEKRWNNRAEARRPTDAAESSLIDATGPGASRPLGPETFHVSAISLGAQRLAIINGKALSEGDSFVAATSSGPISVRVTKIEEGVVHLLAGDKAIDAKVNVTTGQRPAP